MCKYFHFRKLRVQLQDYEKKKEKAYEELEAAVESLACGACSHYNNGTVKKHADRFVDCDCDKSMQLKELATHVDMLEAEADDFLENKYAYEVFQYYSQKEIWLIRNSDNTVVSWKDAFGNEFEKVPKTLKHSLVGLVENSGRYRLK